MFSNLNILIIEDDANDIFLLKTALTEAAQTEAIRVVSDGVEAIDYLRGTGAYQDREQFPIPGVIFADIKMPRMGGFEVLRWLRAHPDCSVIPVVILSASRDEEDVRKAYQMGANAYLAKPLSINRLKQMIRTAHAFWTWCKRPHLPKNC